MNFWDILILLVIACVIRFSLSLARKKTASACCGSCSCAQVACESCGMRQSDSADVTRDTISSCESDFRRQPLTSNSEGSKS